MPAVPSSLIEPIWNQFVALLPARAVSHPLGFHRPRIPDRVVFDRLVQVLVFGCASARIADATCSATTLRRRRDEWIAAGLIRRGAPTSNMSGINSRSAYGCARGDGASLCSRYCGVWRRTLPSERRSTLADSVDTIIETKLV